jgi:hypothetical protein
MCYLHPGWVPHEFVESQLSVLRSRDDVIRVAAQSGPGIARNRNLLAGWFLQESKADWLLWVDSDMVFTAEHLEALLAYEEPLIAAHALRVNPADRTTAPAAVLRQADGSFLPVKCDPEYTGKVAVDGVGMAFTLVHRDVYEAVGVATGHPHRERFAEPITAEMKPFLVGEDVSFCLHAAEKGYQPHLAQDVRVGHVKSAVYA